MTRKEEKRERFKRLAAMRTNVVLDRLRVLGNCANHSVYEYTEEEVRKIFMAIEEELQKTKAKFNPSKDKKKSFTL